MTTYTVDVYEYTGTGRPSTGSVDVVYADVTNYSEEEPYNIQYSYWDGTAYASLVGPRPKHPH